MFTQAADRNTHGLIPYVILVLISSLVFILAPAAQAQVSIAWVTRYGESGLIANPVGVASDAQGNVYVTGYVHITGTAPHRETVTIRYDPSGNVLWADWLGSAAHPSQSQAIGLDFNGNVYVLAAIGLTTGPTQTIANSELAASCGAAKSGIVAPRQGAYQFGVSSNPVKFATHPALSAIRQLRALSDGEPSRLAG